MTTETAAQAALAAAYDTDESEPLIVEPGADDRLAQLHAQYAALKAEADEAAARLKVITDGIKAELTAAAPEGTTKLELRGPVDSGAPTLRLSYVESWRLDSTRLKKTDPVTWVAYAKKSGAWTLKAAPATGGES